VQSTPVECVGSALEIVPRKERLAAISANAVEQASLMKGVAGGALEMGQVAQCPVVEYGDENLD